MAHDEAPPTEGGLPSLAGEIWLAVKADFSEIKQGFAEGSRQAVAEANGQFAKLPTALGDAGTKGGTALAKGVTDKLPSITTATTAEAGKLPAVFGTAGDKGGTALRQQFGKALPIIAANTSDAIGRAGEDGGRKGGERGGRAFGETMNPMIRSAMREGTDSVADALGLWPPLLDPFREALDHIFEKFTTDLPNAAAAGAAAMSTDLTTATAAAGATMDAELVAAGTAGGVGFGSAFSSAVVPAMSGAGAAAGGGFTSAFMGALGPLATIVGSVAGGNAIANWIDGGQRGMFDFPDIPGEAKKTWEMINGTRDPSTGQLYPDPNAPSPPPPPITSAAPPPGYRRSKDDPNRYEPIQPGEPGYVDPNAQVPPFIHVGEGIPVPDPGAGGPKPWWTDKLPKLPKGTPEDPVHTKPPDGGGHGGGGGGGGGAHPASADLPSTGNAKIDAWLLAQVPSGSYGTGDDLTKGLGDCSSAVEDLVDLLMGKSTAGRTLNTMDASKILPALGFIPNYSGANIPGAFNIGYNEHHMQATLPGGTNFNWGSDSAAAKRGMSGGGAFDPAEGFTAHWSKQVGSVPSSPTGTKDDPLHTKDADPKDANAQSLGKGIVDGIFQALGIDGSVFEDFRNWGIWKTMTAGLSDVASYAKSINPAPGSQAESFFSGLGGALGLPDGMGSGGGAGGLLPRDPSDVTAWLPQSQSPDDGGPAGPRGPLPGPVQDNRTITQNNHYTNPPPYPLPVPSGVPGHP